ncbi:MAG: GNAT family N-acetyltransferase [SAR202 cluster bacterium]|nr:GNAT family N-acetyltransferase [SAR202 cluster bacterium]
MTTTTTVHSIPGYPAIYLIDGAEQITIRPMLSYDRDELLEFFRRVPVEDRYFLKEDVASSKVIERWAETLDYSRALPLLALKDSKIIGNGTLHHRRGGSRRHIGEVRIVVDPEYRDRGVGRGLLHKLVEIALDKGLEKLMFELVLDAEEAAKHTAEVLGFVPVAVLPDHVRDYCGVDHDLILMEKRLIKEETDLNAL